MRPELEARRALRRFQYALAPLVDGFPNVEAKNVPKEGHASLGILDAEIAHYGRDDRRTIVMINLAHRTNEAAGSDVAHPPRRALTLARRVPATRHIQNRNYDREHEV